MQLSVSSWIKSIREVVPERVYGDDDMGLGLKKRRRLRISDNLMITIVVFPYGTDSQKVQKESLIIDYFLLMKVVLTFSRYSSSGNRFSR